MAVVVTVLPGNQVDFFIGVQFSIGIGIIKSIIMGIEYVDRRIGRSRSRNKTDRIGAIFAVSGHRGGQVNVFIAACGKIPGTDGNPLPGILLLVDSTGRHAGLQGAVVKNIVGYIRHTAA